MASAFSSNTFYFSSHWTRQLTPQVLVSFFFISLNLKTISLKHFNITHQSISYSGILSFENFPPKKKCFENDSKASVKKIRNRQEFFFSIPLVNLCFGGESLYHSVFISVELQNLMAVFWIRKSVKSLFPPVMSDSIRFYFAVVQYFLQKLGVIS